MKTKEREKKWKKFRNGVSGAKREKKTRGKIETADRRKKNQ